VTERTMINGIICATGLTTVYPNNVDNAPRRKYIFENL